MLSSFPLDLPSLPPFPPILSQTILWILLSAAIWFYVFQMIYANYKQLTSVVQHRPVLMESFSPQPQFTRVSDSLEVQVEDRNVDDEEAGSDQHAPSPSFLKSKLYKCAL